MAAIQSAAHGPKPSFAKVAASTSADGQENSLPSRQSDVLQNSSPSLADPGPVVANGAGSRGSPPQIEDGSVNKAGMMPSSIENVTGSLTHLNLNAGMPSLVVNGSTSPAAQKISIGQRDSASDDSAKADSGSELGAKPPSIDGKSITSGTTFALDEKESLRPDDSASVKAAAEDDDGLSIRGSLLAGSRLGSDIAARSRGIALGDIPERRLAQAPPGGILTPQSGSSEQKPGVDPSIPLGADGGSSDALNVIYRQAPDDKLLEAMQSPRDRLFLLRLEKEVIEFVQDSKEPYMDLPPSNSFCRMLIHKLADYYHMTHSYEHHIGSVRIFRTPFCRVPPSLSSMISEPNPSASSTPPPAILPKKIMRRGQEGETGTTSASASKATSEVGSDEKEKPAGNQKLTREKREEMYKQARERIFGSAEDTAPDTETDHGMSRTSSTSAQNRSNVGKRGKTGKQRRDDSDSFDSRNQYTPYWGPQQQTWVPQSYPQPQPGSVAPQSGHNYQPPPPQSYSQQGGAYPQTAPMMPPNQPYPQYAMPQPYATQPARGYQPTGSPMASFGSPIPVQAPHNWQQPYTSAPYASRGSSTGSPAQMGQVIGQQPGPAPIGQPPNMSIPYAYGQLPAHINPHDPKSQHPIPGSYNRNHGFNPQTQSFIPGSNNMPVPHGPQPPFTAPGSHHSSPQIGSTHLAYPGYQGPPQQPYPGGYGMARQLSNTSMPGYATHQQMMPPHGQHPGASPHKQPHMQPQHAHIHGTASQGQYAPPRPQPQHQPHNQAYGHLPTYGNPASLPQKPGPAL
ncbi:SUZ domain-containing protein [Sarocladium implicatum]|nr:SUZ domain-containing protein [Sarocladium implicatum]